MEKLQQLYEGKAKRVYATEDPEKYIVDYKDDATAFNGFPPIMWRRSPTGRPSSKR